MRKRLAALVAAFAALALVAAAQPTQPVGTAQTQMTAAELTVTGVSSPVDGLTLLDIQTFASTDTDTAKNAAGAPFSTAGISPVKLNGEDLVDPVSVRSDGDTSESTATFDENVGLASIALNPLGMTANAGADTATATVSAATAQVTALSDALGIELNHVPGVSSVDANGATATSGISVSGVELSLGELLPVDLGDLPLDTLLGLATLLEDQLSVTGLDLTALNAAISALEGAVDELDSLLGQYGTAVGELNDVIADINAAVADLVEVTDATQLQTDLSTVQQITSDAQDLLDSGITVASITDGTTLSTVNAWITTYNDLYTGTYPGCADCDTVALLDVAALVTLTATDPAAAIAAVESTLQSLVTEAGTLASYIQGGLNAVNTITTLGAEGGALDEAIGAVDAAVAAIEDFLATTDLSQLITDLTDILNGLLELVPELIGDLDVSSLLDVDPLGVTVGATATADSATPSITCGGGGVAVAGIQVVSDIDGCDAVNGVGDTLDGALATVGDVLGTLTDVDVPTPSLELFTERRESSGTDGAYRTATAGITALILDLPSVDLDAVVQGVLDGGLSTLLETDVFELLNALAAELTTEISEINGDAGDLIAGAVGTALGELETTVTETTVDTTGVDEAEAALDALLAELAGLIAGAVPDTGLMTPGVNLKVDPVSTVEFAPGSTSGAPTPPSGGEPAPGSDPAPAPEPAPSLPATGGGLALLGALALAGAVALRRRP